MIRDVTKCMLAKSILKIHRHYYTKELIKAWNSLTVTGKVNLERPCVEVSMVPGATKVFKRLKPGMKMTLI